MVERALSNLEVWVWEYQENTKNYPGLHFTARPMACEVLHQCLVELLSSVEGGRRLIPLQKLKPADEAKITGGQQYTTFRALRLIVTPERDDLRQMYISTEGDKVVFEVTPSRVEDVLKGMKDIQAGTGDYCIGPERNRKKGRSRGALDHVSKEFWFWPCFGHLGPS